PLTPALSSASGADSLVFTAFEDNRYNIYALDRSSSAPVSAALSTEQNAAALPPAARQPGEVQALLEAPARFLPQPQEYPEQEYKAGLSLDAIAQPTVGVGAVRFGAYAAGGLSLLWSDMLGNHELGTTVLLSSRLEEMGGAIAYM